MRIWLTLLLMGFALLAVGTLTHRAPAIALVNRSGVEIVEASLRVGDQPNARADLGLALAGGQTVPVRAEGKAQLRLRFADGTDRSFDAGWFIPVAREDLRVVVESTDSVRFERN